MNYSKLIDVHTFDRKIDTSKIKSRITAEDKQKLFKWLMEETTKLKLRNDGINLVIQDTHKQPNHDPVNNVYADDILAEICLYLVMKDDAEITANILKLVSEQMVDMADSGRCPQGRSIRLFQIYLVCK